MGKSLYKTSKRYAQNLVLSAQVSYTAASRNEIPQEICEMQYTENDYAALTLFKQRQQELMNQAENERLAKQKNPVRRLRRTIRINND